jgi:uncharacterized integral membrane protein
MQFLKTLFWIVLTVIVVLFARANWKAVEVKLWGGLIADAKLPVVLLLFFLLGFLPTLIYYRAKLWSLKRRYEPLERGAQAAGTPAAVPIAPAAGVSVPVSNSPDAPSPPVPGDAERIATDTKVWPPA